MFAALRRLLARYNRVVQIGLYAVIGFVIVGAIGTVAFIEYSAKPSFCLNCHLMKPYYDSWATSSHKNVPCIKCHYAPGVKAEAMGKLQAANQVVKYITGTYGTKPWAEIEDAACLRSGCHVEMDLNRDIDFRGVMFNHQEHLGELRRGKQLRCTSCHSQIVQGQHVTVTEGTCFLCHFKERPPSEPVAGCVGCHPSPPRLETAQGAVIDHPQYVQNLVSCLTCHNQVTHGDGAAEQARCFNCHNEPARIAEFDNTTLIHRVHVADRNVECQQCHRPIEHRVVSLSSTRLPLDCSSCHSGVHDAQQDLLAGVGAHGTTPMPSAMYTASVSCSSCHDRKTITAGHATVKKAGEASCLSCHGIRYANVLPSWQQAMQRRLTAAGNLLRRVNDVRGLASVRSRGAVDSLLKLASDNVELVRLGKSAHNVPYADQALRSAVDYVRQATRAGGLPLQVSEGVLGPPVSGNVCLSCHLGAERKRVAFQGRAFDHGTHVLVGGLSCTECHTPLADHGKTTLTSTASCDACHHGTVRSRNCATCHEGPGGAPAAPLRMPQGDFSHEIHRNAQLACSQCHQAPTMQLSVQCTTCHESHHTPTANCLSCHREGALAAHTRDDHVSCVLCHKPPAQQLDHWTRQICLACHADKGNHYPAKPCAACHQIPPMDAHAQRPSRN